ncbi:MAG: DUF983 domain-containing protein [Rubricella sp.]
MTEETNDASAERDVNAALWRGWRRRCPNCGSGPMFRGYLAVRKTCPVCGEELFHHRADDGPAWATMLIAGHLMAPALLFVFETWQPQGWTMAIGFSILFSVLSLYLLPRIKGMFVGFQWAKRMFGFGDPATL